MRTGGTLILGNLHMTSDAPHLSLKVRQPCWTVGFRHGLVFFKRWRTSPSEYGNGMKMRIHQRFGGYPMFRPTWPKHLREWRGPSIFQISVGPQVLFPRLNLHQGFMNPHVQQPSRSCHHLHQISGRMWTQQGMWSTLAVQWWISWALTSSDPKLIPWFFGVGTKPPNETTSWPLAVSPADC